MKNQLKFLLASVGVQKNPKHFVNETSKDFEVETYRYTDVPFNTAVLTMELEIEGCV